MITVSVLDLFIKTSELIHDGVGKVELNELDGDDESPRSLSFSAVDDDSDECIDYEEIDDVEDVSCPGLDTIELSTDSYAPHVFTMHEISLVLSALHNAISHCLSILDIKSISAEERSKTMQLLKAYQSLVNDLESHFSAT